MNILKEEIINKLFQQPEDLSNTDFTNYRLQYPYDVDMYLLEGYWQIIHNNLSQAKELLLLSKEHNPYNIDTYFLLGECYLLLHDYYTSMECYLYAHSLSRALTEKIFFYNDDIFQEKVHQVQLMLENSVNTANPEAVKYYNTKLQMIDKHLENYFDLFFNTLYDINKNQIGEILFHISEGERFCGYGNVLDVYSYKNYTVKPLRYFKGELLKIRHEGSSFSPNAEGTVLLPIASREPNNRITIHSQDGSCHVVPQVGNNHFNYYRMEGKAQISSDHPMIVGEPIRLHHNPSHKKLVISFFVDGFSQKLLQEEGLEHVMPNTFQFFSKGLICENFFTTSDWTYPSLPSFVTGTTLPNHMMFHPAINKMLPVDQKVLFEYFKDAGYYTAMINSDGRSTATLGYTRGIDRYITQDFVHLRAGHVISDAIEHIEAFRDTDQFLWLTYPDLHDVADGCDLPISVQTKLDCGLRQKEEKAPTSIQQKYSPQKRAAYIQALRTADIRFLSLYSYLEQHFTDDEFIITMFGDHGQTYLLHPEEHRLARYHSNVVFMVRGGGYSGISQEYMSAVDYPHILCKLANLSALPQTPEGQLPKTFGGEVERDFTITETIHPDRPYAIAIHAKDHIFYLTTKNKITDDGRLDFNEFEMKLVDNMGRNSIDNPKLIEYYMNLIKDRLKYIILY